VKTAKRLRRCTDVIHAWDGTTRFQTRASISARPIPLEYERRDGYVFMAQDRVEEVRDGD
jgi:hypothetical protein